MLGKILAYLETERRAVSIAEMSRALHAQPGAIAGMLDLLVRKGRVIEIGAGRRGEFCEECAWQSTCALLTAPIKRYILAQARQSLCGQQKVFANNAADDIHGQHDDEDEYQNHHHTIVGERIDVEVQQ